MSNLSSCICLFMLSLGLSSHTYARTVVFETADKPTFANELAAYARTRCNTVASLPYGGWDEAVYRTAPQSLLTENILQMLRDTKNKVQKVTFETEYKYPGIVFTLNHDRTLTFICDYLPLGY